MTALAANITSCTVSSLDVLVFRKLVRSIGQIAARRTNAAAHPRWRILFCSSRSSIENSRCCRAARTVAKNIRAAISYRIVSPRSNFISYPLLILLAFSFSIHTWKKRKRFENDGMQTSITGRKNFRWSRRIDLSGRWGRDSGGIVASVARVVSHHCILRC